MATAIKKQRRKLKKLGNGLKTGATAQQHSFPIAPFEIGKGIKTGVTAALIATVLACAEPEIGDGEPCLEVENIEPLSPRYLRTQESVSATSGNYRNRSKKQIEGFTIHDGKDEGLHTDGLLDLFPDNDSRYTIFIEAEEKILNYFNEHDLPDTGSRYDSEDFYAMAKCAKAVYTDLIDSLIKSDKGKHILPADIDLQLLETKMNGYWKANYNAQSYDYDSDTRSADEKKMASQIRKELLSALRPIKHINDFLQQVEDLAQLEAFVDYIYEKTPYYPNISATGGRAKSQIKNAELGIADVSAVPLETRKTLQTEAGLLV